MKKLFKYILLIILPLSMTSCYYDEVFEADITPGTVSFADDVLSVISLNNCASCHDGTLNPDLTAGNEYNSLVPDYVMAGDADNSLLYTKLLNGHAGVNANSLALIREWINSGALNN